MDRIGPERSLPPPAEAVRDDEIDSHECEAPGCTRAATDQTTECQWLCPLHMHEYHNPRIP